MCCNLISLLPCPSRTLLTRHLRGTFWAWGGEQLPHSSAALPTLPTFAPLFPLVFSHTYFPFHASSEGF